MTMELVSFSDKGAALAQRLAANFEGARHTAAHGAAGFSLHTFAQNAFASADAIVFVGAVGVAVRAVAPFVQSKSTDPAVVVADEGAHFIIPILSGHMGGANALARRLALLCGAVPVITTATDVNRRFAVDEWAQKQGCLIQNPQKIKAVSARVLAGETVLLRTAWHICGKPPAGVRLTTGESCDFVLSVHNEARDALWLVPRVAVLGVGCRKGTTRRTLEAAFAALLEKEQLCAQAVCLVCSIVLKQNEPGLLAFCEAHGLALQTFSAAQLGEARGTFTPSRFVQSVTGVDNVCERSAALGSGGPLLIQKTVGEGVTMAVALKPFCPDWSWQR